MARKMKDSGVEWIGQIPEDWEIRKIKNQFIIYTGNSIPDSEKENYCDSEDAIPYIPTKEIDTSTSKINYENGMYIKKGDNAFKVAPVGSVLMCIEGGSAGKKIAYVEQDVCFVNKLCCFNPKEINSRYAYYYLKSASFNAEFNLHISGLIGGVSQSEIKEFVVVLPQITEQQKIADFLDEKVGEIDTLIAKTKESIEEYKRYKQAVITEAVTKGLDRTVPMKNSKNNYIGKIPVHWNEKKLRFLGVCQNGISKSAEYFGTGYPFISYGDVYRNFALPEQGSGLIESSETDRDIYSVKRGDVFFTRTSETIEEVGFTSTCLKTVDNATFAGFIIRFRPNSEEELLPEFSKYYFRSDIHRKFFVKEMNLVTRASLSQELLKKLPVLLPSIKEQEEIAKYLDEKCGEIDALIAKKEAFIKEMEDYKKSLIYEYVTGKKEVV